MKKKANKRVDLATTVLGPSSPPPASANGDETFTDEDLMNEWRWLYDEKNRPLLAPHAGRYVAVHRQTILGSARDPDLLRLYLSEKYHINPDRIVTKFLD
jgi:hypothetical protein